ncbi:MAG: hypothetical protein NC311_02985 [Muribaculaceae bacterium]|nr:hypothetical protein [Muribaculaceae bacterium]
MAKRVRLFGSKKSEDAYTRYRRATDDFMDAIEQERSGNNATRYRVDNYSIGFMSDCFLPADARKKRIARIEYCIKQYDKSLQEVDKNPRMICHQYDWGQFLEYVNWHGNEDKRASQRNYLFNDWCGTKTFQEAMDLARNGWNDLDKIIPNVQRFPLPKIKSVSDMVCRYNVAGGAVDIGRYLAGMPDCMRHMAVNDEFMRPAKCMKLLFTFDIHCGYSAMQLASAGYRAYEMVDMMESANIHTEVVFHVRDQAMALGVERKPCCTGIYDVYVTVKKPDEVLNLSRIMFAMAHPSMLRRLVFSEMERNPQDVIKQFLFVDRCGYGHPTTLDRGQFENTDDVIYMIASDLFSEKFQDVVHAQNEKIARALASQKYSHWR